MSKMIPDATVNTFRKNMDIMINIYGIDCTLYHPTNLEATEDLSIYNRTPAKLDYTDRETQVRIEWSANKARLKKLGVYSEDTTPIVAWFKNSDKVLLDCYISLPIKYIPLKGSITSNTTKSQEFVLVNSISEGMDDSELLTGFVIAPRRTK